MFNGLIPGPIVYFFDSTSRQHINVRDISDIVTPEDSPLLYITRDDLPDKILTYSTVTKRDEVALALRELVELHNQDSL